MSALKKVHKAQKIQRENRASKKEPDNPMSLATSGKDKITSEAAAASQKALSACSSAQSSVRAAHAAHTAHATSLSDCCGDPDSPRRYADITTAEATLPGDDVIYKVSEIFSALADSTRLKILSSLMNGELCVCEMQEVCDVSQSAVSHQLRLLRDRGLVRSRRDGQRSVYRLADEHVSLLIHIGIEHATEEGR